jgi:hypothetical protein
VEVTEEQADLLRRERRGRTSTLVGPVIYTIGGRKCRPDSSYNREVSSGVGTVLL